MADVSYVRFKLKCIFTEAKQNVRFISLLEVIYITKLIVSLVFLWRNFFCKAATQVWCVNNLTFASWYRFTRDCDRRTRLTSHKFGYYGG